MSVQLLDLSCDTCGSKFQFPVENLFFDYPSQVPNLLGRSVVLSYCPPCHPSNPQVLPDDFRTYGAGITENVCLCDRSMKRNKASYEAFCRADGDIPAVCKPRHAPVVPEACEFYTQIHPNLVRMTRMAATRNELLFVRHGVHEVLFAVRAPCCNKTVRVTCVGLNELVDHGSAGLLGPVVEGERCLLVVYGCSTCKMFHPVPDEEYAPLLKMGVQISKKPVDRWLHAVVVQRRVAFEGKGPSDAVLFVAPAREGPLRFGPVDVDPALAAFAFGRPLPAPVAPGPPEVPREAKPTSVFGSPVRVDAPTPVSAFGKPPVFGSPSVVVKPAFAFGFPQAVPVQKPVAPVPAGFSFGRAPAAPVQEPVVAPAFSFAPKPAEISKEDKELLEERKVIAGFSFGAPAPTKE